MGDIDDRHRSQRHGRAQLSAVCEDTDTFNQFTGTKYRLVERHTLEVSSSHFETAVGPKHCRTHHQCVRAIAGPPTSDGGKFGFEAESTEALP